MRHYAAELFNDVTETQALARRHATYVRAEVERIGEVLTSTRESEGVRMLGELWPNLRSAFDWAIAEGDYELGFALLRPISLEVVARRGVGEIQEWVERLLPIMPADRPDDVGEVLLWAALYLSMTHESERCRELIDTYGDPENTLAHYAVLVGVQDKDFGALTYGPLAAALMRDRGQLAVSRLFEVFTGGALMSAGRFDESQQQLNDLADQLRADGPPSMLNWALFMLGAAAEILGDPELAGRHWAEIASTELAPRTNSPHDTLSARTAFRQGRRHEAYALLHNFFQELLEDDNASGVVLGGVEFVNIMVELGRLSDAAEVLGHFETYGMFDFKEPNFSTLVADAARVVDADVGASQHRADAVARGISEAEASQFMCDVLAELLAVSEA